MSDRDKTQAASRDYRKGVGEGHTGVRIGENIQAAAGIAAGVGGITLDVLINDAGLTRGAANLLLKTIREFPVGGGLAHKRSEMRLLGGSAARRWDQLASWLDIPKQADTIAGKDLKAAYKAGTKVDPEYLKKNWDKNFTVTDKAGKKHTVKLKDLYKGEDINKLDLKNYRNDPRYRRAQYGHKQFRKGQGGVVSRVKQIPAAVKATPEWIKGLPEATKAKLETWRDRLNARGESVKKFLTTSGRDTIESRAQGGKSKTTKPATTKPASPSGRPLGHGYGAPVGEPGQAARTRASQKPLGHGYGGSGEGAQTTTEQARTQPQIDNDVKSNRADRAQFNKSIGDAKTRKALRQVAIDNGIPEEEANKVLNKSKNLAEARKSFRSFNNKMRPISGTDAGQKLVPRVPPGGGPWKFIRAVAGGGLAALSKASGPAYGATIVGGALKEEIDKSGPEGVPGHDFSAGDVGRNIAADATTAAGSLPYDMMTMIPRGVNWVGEQLGAGKDWVPGMKEVRGADAWRDRIGSGIRHGMQYGFLDSGLASGVPSIEAQHRAQLGQRAGPVDWVAAEDAKRLQGTSFDPRLRLMGKEGADNSAQVFDQMREQMRPPARSWGPRAPGVPPMDRPFQGPSAIPGLRPPARPSL